MFLVNFWSTFHLKNYAANNSRIFYPMPLLEFISLIGKDDNIITISTFEKNSNAVFNINYQEYLKNPVKYVMRDILGYSLKNSKLLLDDVEIVPDAGALEKFLESFRDHKEEFIKEGISKIWQLRMHKNISNKLLPVLIAWERIMLDDNANDYHQMKITIDKLRQSIDNLYKWFLICYSKTNLKFLNCYEEDLQELIANFKKFQIQAHSVVITNMEK